MPKTSMLSGTPPTPEEAAEALVRDYCGWHVAPILEETITLDGEGQRRLFLPSLRVLEVTEVRLDDRVLSPEDYSWTASGVLYRASGWPEGYRNVQVTLSHGNEPADVRWIVDSIVARLKAAPAGRLQRKNVGQIGAAWENGAGSATRLFRDERDALAPYKLTRSAADV